MDAFWTLFALVCNGILPVVCRSIPVKTYGSWLPYESLESTRPLYYPHADTLHYPNMLNSDAYHNVYKQSEKLPDSVEWQSQETYPADYILQNTQDQYDWQSERRVPYQDYGRIMDNSLVGYDLNSNTNEYVTALPVAISDRENFAGNKPIVDDYSELHEFSDHGNDLLHIEGTSSSTSFESKEKLSNMQSNSPIVLRDYIVSAGLYENESSLPSNQSFISKPLHDVKFDSDDISANVTRVDHLFGNFSLIDPRDSTSKDMIDFQSSGDFPTLNHSFESEDSKFEAFDSNLDEDVSRDLDYDAKKNKFLKTLDERFRSLVFNPTAQSSDKFQSCVTPMNETGNCRYVQHCLLPSILGSIDNFMNYVCIIGDRYIGICCPELPVSTVTVAWEDTVVVKGTNGSDNRVDTPKECGIGLKTRIVGGSKTDPKAWPWMAALLTMSKGQFFCGGALINNLYVLTAAHCTFRVPKNQILVRLGEYDFGVHDEDSPGEDFPVVEIKRHGQYSRRTLHNDIALLRLARPAVLKKNIGTICLPAKRSYVGEIGILAGWGNVKGSGPTSPVLLEASLPIDSNANCSRDHGTPISDNLICTRSESKSKGACNGDSGGPLMHLDESLKRWKVIGLVSWGRRGCDPKYPTVYTRVSGYDDWIHAHAV